MRKILFLLLLICNLSLSSQNCWEKSYDFKYNAFVKTLNNKYFFIGTSYADMSMKWKLMQASADGKIEWDSTYLHGNPGTILPRSIVATPDSGVLIGCYNWGANFLKYDKHNKLISNKFITNSFGLDAVGAITPTRDGNFLAVLGSKILKLSSQGDSLWMKDTGYPIKTGLIKIDSESEGYYCMGMKYFDNESRYVNELLKISEDGNVIFSKAMDEYNSVTLPTSFLATKDGALMVLYDNNMVFTKMEVSGNIIWARDYTGIGPNTKCWTMTATQDGGFMTANTVTFIGNNPTIYLMKLNANGDSIYSIKDNTAILYPVKIIEDTSDNTFVFNASTSYYDDSRFYKFDSVCHVITSVNKIKSSRSQLHCSPNPAINQLNISLDNFQNKSGIVCLYNCKGEIVLQQKITIGIDHLQINKLSQGIYFLRLIVENEAFSCKVIKE